MGYEFTLPEFLENAIETKSDTRRDFFSPSQAKRILSNTKSHVRLISRCLNIAPAVANGYRIKPEVKVISMPTSCRRISRRKVKVHRILYRKFSVDPFKALPRTSSLIACNTMPRAGLEVARSGRKAGADDLGSGSGYEMCVLLVFNLIPIDQRKVR